MSQTLVRNYVHIVFSTKYRQPLITPDVLPPLCRYLATLCNDMESPAVCVGGYRDHVHILCLLSRKMALSKLLEELKAHSSKWIKTLRPGLETFYWQNGYGAFSVNPTEVEKVMAYISSQEVHHRQDGFQDELRRFLRKYKVPYDERYLWD